MIATALPSAASTSSGFNWGGLVLLILVLAVFWPFWRRVRARISRQRRERWAREEHEDDRAGFTPETDPDLRGDDTPATSSDPADPPTSR